MTQEADFEMPYPPDLGKEGGYGDPRTEAERKTEEAEGLLDLIRADIDDDRDKGRLPHWPGRLRADRACPARSWPAFSRICLAKARYQYCWHGRRGHRAIAVFSPQSLFSLAPCPIASSAPIQTCSAAVWLPKNSIR